MNWRGFDDGRVNVKDTTEGRCDPLLLALKRHHAWPRFDIAKELRMRAKIDPELKFKVNAGWLCPECLSDRVSCESESHFECQECGCRWDHDYYPTMKEKK
jgi:ribosomal protein L37AE/L43A